MSVIFYVKFNYSNSMNKKKLPSMLIRVCRHTPMMVQFLKLKKSPKTPALLPHGRLHELFYVKMPEPRPVGRCADQDVRRPFHSLEPYLARLVKLGESAVICEQIGDPATSKGPVERAVARIVTPAR